MLSRGRRVDACQAAGYCDRVAREGTRPSQGQSGFRRVNKSVFLQSVCRIYRVSSSAHGLCMLGQGLTSWCVWNCCWSLNVSPPDTQDTHPNCLAAVPARSVRKSPSTIFTKPSRSATPNHRKHTATTVDGVYSLKAWNVRGVLAPSRGRTHPA